MTYELADKLLPKFYGAVRVGERGQVAIPAEARRELEIGHNTKLLAFGGQGKEALIFVKAEFFAQFLANITGMLSQFEQAMATDSEETPATGP